MNNKKEDKNKINKALGFYAHIGISMAVAIFGCTLIGNVIDNVLGTSPIFLIIFMLLGVASAYLLLYKEVKRFIDTPKK